MGRVVCFSRSTAFRELLGGLGGDEVIFLESMREFAAALVEGRGIVCALVHLRTPDDAWIRLLSSAKASFPFLDMALVLEEGGITGTSFASLFRGDPAEDRLFGEIVRHIQSLECRDKRGKQRFDWPLEGTLHIVDGSQASYKVRSISASGAFLEVSQDHPRPGMRGMLSIRFQDFSVWTSVEILPARSQTGSLPEGFGVRFIDLTEGSQRVIDRLVQDELLRQLIEPDGPLRPPAIAP